MWFKIAHAVTFDCWDTARFGLIPESKRVNPSPAADFLFQGWLKSGCMHFYKFHIGDYMSHTRHLSLYEDLAYRRLLDFYFLHEQPIKHRDAARQIGMRDHEEDVLTVLNEFFLSTDDGFVNPRANKEIMEFRVHQATSAYGAFVRDNPDLKQYVLKDVYIQHFMNGTVDTYIDSLKSHHVGMMGTSSAHDATNNHKPITNNHKEKKEKATVVACPPDVGQQIWDDWKQLRKAKNAPVTETVVKSARKEALKANMAFEDFLSVWCARGSQGLQADWLKPDERNLSKTGQMNQRVISGLTRGLIGGNGNVKLLGN